MCEDPLPPNPLAVSTRHGAHFSKCGCLRIKKNAAIGDPEMGLASFDVSLAHYRGEPVALSRIVRYKVSIEPCRP